MLILIFIRSDGVRPESSGPLSYFPRTKLVPLCDLCVLQTAMLQTPRFPSSAPAQPRPPPPNRARPRPPAHSLKRHQRPPVQQQQQQQQQPASAQFPRTPPRPLFFALRQKSRARARTRTHTHAHAHHTRRSRTLRRGLGVGFSAAGVPADPVRRWSGPEAARAVCGPQCPARETPGTKPALAPATGGAGPLRPGAAAVP